MQGKVRSPGLVILFSILSCGIYAIYWYVVVSQEINRACKREVIPMWIVILSIFCAPMFIYYFYLMDKGLMECCGSRGYNSNFVLWLILTLVVGCGSLVMMFQTQDALNGLWQDSTGSSTPDGTSYTTDGTDYTI